MHLANCEHPLIVYNHILHKTVSVPCGHCNTCNVNRATSWVARLDAERCSSGFCIFFTLTYSDDFLPVLEQGYSRSAFIPDLLVHKKRDFSKIPSFNIVNDGIVTFKNKIKFLSDENNDFTVPLYPTILSEQSTQNILNLHAQTIPYCSIYDIQTFVKRLRSHAYRKAFGTDKGLDESQKIRYFVASEYGPTTLRPHYHGLLFFDDIKIADIITDALSSSWLLGSIKFESVSSSASSYVAKYINSFNHLPRIYRSKSLRPFAVSSKRVPIGLRSFEDETIRELFNSSSPVMSYTDKTSGEISFVPLWRCLEDRLYPKLPYYSSLDSLSRFSILRETTFDYEGVFCLSKNQKDIDGYVSSSRLSSYDEFCAYCAKRVSLNLEYKVSSNLFIYLCYIVPFLNSIRYSDDARIYYTLYNSNSFRRLYYVARRISLILHEYDISLQDYLFRLDSYYNNKDIYRLQEQYLFEEDFVLSCSSQFLLNIDPVRYDYFRHCSYSCLTANDILILEGFGFTFGDIHEIYKDDASRRAFFRNYHVSRCMDFQDMQAVNKKIYHDSLKTRKKNEYLKLHPEFSNLY